MNSISHLYLFGSLSFSVCCVFKSRIFNVHLLSVFRFSFMAPVEGLCCKLKYRANIIHRYIFVFFLYFFYHSSCRKDQFNVLKNKNLANHIIVSRVSLPSVVRRPPQVKKDRRIWLREREEYKSDFRPGPFLFAAHILEESSVCPFS